MRAIWVVSALLVLVFISQNLESVEISLILGRPVEVPLALVIFTAFLVGLMAGIGLVVGRRWRKNAVADDWTPEGE